MHISHGSANDVPVQEETCNLTDEITADLAGISEVHTYNGDPADGDMKVIVKAKDIVTTILYVEDDISLNPWTFRMFSIGKPQPSPSRTSPADSFYRIGFGSVRVGSAGNLLLQAPGDT